MDPCIDQMYIMCEQHPKLCQIPVGGSFWTTPQWVDVNEYRKGLKEELPPWKPEDNIEEHELNIPPASDNDSLSREQREQLALEEYLGEMLAYSHSSHTPLWYARLVHGLEGRAALAIGIHHCVSDGLGCVLIILSFMKTSTGESAAHYLTQNYACWP